MSILIRGMEMPTSCISCLLNFGEKRPEYGLTIYCPYSDGVISWRDKAFDNGRLASCGIVPVPPHGRLIEESKVLDIVFEWCPDDDGSVGKDGDLREMLDEIEAIPTIIPAEEGE